MIAFFPTNYALPYLTFEDALITFQAPRGHQEYRNWRKARAANLYIYVVAYAVVHVG